MLNSFIYTRPRVLNMMRRFTRQKELLRPAKTRFATAFITLSSIFKQKSNLRKMFISEEWANSKWAKEQQGKRAKSIVMMPGFWNSILFCLKVSSPLVHVLRLVDGERKPAMGYIYEAMDRAKESIASSFKNNIEKYEHIFGIIDRRWDVQLHRPFHAAGYFLNPEFFYSNSEISTDDEVNKGLLDCIQRLIPSGDIQDKITDELVKYREALGTFGSQMAIRQRKTRAPDLDKFALFLMDRRHYFSVQVMVMAIVYFSCNRNCNCDRIDSSSEMAETCNSNLMESATFAQGCLPCNQEYISASYFNNHDKLVDSEFHNFLFKSIQSADLCKETMNHAKMIKLLGLKRDLIGEGSHRDLVSTIILNKQPNDSIWFHENICNIVLIERLPTGVFADPFELQHLVERKIFSSAGVFGDTNLELPSALSNRTVTEIQMDIGSINGIKNSEIVTRLPLHARYPPLDSSNDYTRVEFGDPDLLVRCRPKYLQDESCFCAVSNLYSETNSLVWQIPCGNEALSGIVFGITFGSALLCSFMIICSTVYFSRKQC